MNLKFKKSPELILKELGIYSADNINLDLIAYSLNADIKYQPLKGCEGSIIGSSSRAIISINNSVIPSRQRFSLGHELGHWINDKGIHLTFKCNENDMKQNSFKQGDLKQHREVRANKFSAELLMPKFIIDELFDNFSITFATVKKISKVFRTSQLSSAIRIIDIADYPCMLVCWDNTGKRKWFVRNSILPEFIWPHEIIINPKTNFKESNGIEVDADKWINSKSAEDYSVFESVTINDYYTLSLIWWKDESQLLHM